MQACTVTACYKFHILFDAMVLTSQAFPPRSKNGIWSSIRRSHIEHNLDGLTLQEVRTLDQLHPHLYFSIEYTHETYSKNRDGGKGNNHERLVGKSLNKHSKFLMSSVQRCRQ